MSKVGALGAPNPACTRYAHGDDRRLPLWQTTRLEARAMITLDLLRQIILALPTTEETTSWGAVSFKVNGKVMLFWNRPMTARSSRCPSRSAIT